jgi:phosphoribosylformylglycinamidine synthase
MTLDAAEVAPSAAVALFSESHTRFLCEVRPEDAAAFTTLFEGLPLLALGEVTAEPRLVIRHGGADVVDADIAQLKQAWIRPLDVLDE